LRRRLRDSTFSSLIQYRRVTDGRTHDDSIYRVSTASRGNAELHNGSTDIELQWLISKYHR